MAATETDTTGSPKRNIVSFEAPEDVAEAIEKAIKRTGVSKTFLLNTCLRVGLAPLYGKRNAERVTDAQRWSDNLKGR